MTNYQYYKENNIKFPLTKEMMIYYLKLGYNVACWYYHNIGICYITANLRRGDEDIHINQVHCLNIREIRMFLKEHKLRNRRWLMFL